VAKTAKAKTIYRVACRHKPYAQLGNAMIRDNRLSFEARGVLAYILSFPTNWQFGQDWLCKKTGLGRDRSYRIVKELCTYGYCLRQQPRREDGTHGPYEYVFTDEPGAIEGAPNDDTQDVGGGPSGGSVKPQENAPPLPEKPEAAEPDPVQPEAAQPDPAKAEAHKEKNTISPKDREKTKTESGFLFSVLGTDGACDTIAALRGQAAQAERAACSVEVACGERVPFTPEVLREVGALGLDVEALIERYQRKTFGRTIAEPGAYLLQMARDEAAKVRGVTPDTVTRISKAARAEQARRAADETTQRAQSEPTDRALQSIARSARLRGHDPAGLIDGWRRSLGERRFVSRAAADASLAAFATARFYGQEARP
jgi:hypothetical protein